MNLIDQLLMSFRLLSNSGSLSLRKLYLHFILSSLDQPFLNEKNTGRKIALKTQWLKTKNKQKKNLHIRISQYCIFTAVKSRGFNLNFLTVLEGKKGTKNEKRFTIGER